NPRLRQRPRLTHRADSPRRPNPEEKQEMKLRMPRPRRAVIAVAVAAALVVAVVPGQVAVAAPADGTVRTFDDETLGAAPSDCDVIGDVAVTEAGFGGAPATNRAMRLVDQSNTVYTWT